MTDQELRISVAKACGLEVVIDPKRWSDLPEGTLFASTTRDANLQHVVRDIRSYGDENVCSEIWNPLNNLELAYECAEKVWTEPWVFSVADDFTTGDRKYYATVWNESNNYEEYTSDFFETPARAICDAIHKWSTERAGSR